MPSEPPPGLYHGPAGGLTAPPRLSSFSRYAHVLYSYILGTFGATDVDFFSVLNPDYVKTWMDFNVLLFLINLWLLKFDEERNLQSFLYITFQIPAWVTDTKISGLWVYGSIGKIAQNMTNINNEKKKTLSLEKRITLVLYCTQNHNILDISKS